MRFHVMALVLSALISKNFLGFMQNGGRVKRNRVFKRKLNNRSEDNGIKRNFLYNVAFHIGHSVKGIKKQVGNIQNHITEETSGNHDSR